MNGYQPMDGERYWCIRGIRPWVCSHVWEGDRLDQLLRDTGRTFKTEDEARAALAARVAPIAPPEPQPPWTTKQRFDELVGTLSDPVERLRFFCSLAMSGQDWLDVEPLFDAIPPPSPLDSHQEQK